MKKLLITLLLITSYQAAAVEAVYSPGYRQFAAASKAAATKLLSKNDIAELSIDMSYRTTTPTDHLMLVTRVTRGYHDGGYYQYGYQYLCRKTRQKGRTYQASASLCGEMVYTLDYRKPGIKKAL